MNRTLISLKPGVAACITCLTFSALQIRAANSTSNEQAATTASFSQTSHVSLQKENLRLNFQAAPLTTVLDYFSETAGLIIVVQTSVREPLNLQTDHALSLGEAIETFDTALEPQGATARLNGRTLSILNRDNSKSLNLPVKLGSNPDEIPATEHLVTQILPVRFVEVSELVKNLQPLVSSKATLAANQSANSLVITDVEKNIQRLARIIQAIDSSAEGYTAVRVFKLLNSNPSEMVDLLSTLFPDTSNANSSTQSTPQFGGPPQNFGGPGGGPAFSPPGFDRGPGGNNSQGNSGSQSQRVQKRDRVVAVADDRTSSVVISAQENLMAEIEKIVQELDSNPANKQTVGLYQLKNARPNELNQVLQAIFQKNTTSTSPSRNNSTQTDPLDTRSTSQSQQNSGNSRGAGQNGASGGFGGTQGGGPTGQP